jgi:hypothetical protein
MQAGRHPRQSAARGAGVVVVVAALAVAQTPAEASAELAKLSGRVDELSYKLNDTRKSNDQIDSLILTPVAILVSILAAGGALGIVFSVRDQRRFSQLHGLAVSAEVTAQRRADESYNTFLGESQKTLTLVNDTLRLAKEASDREARSMELKTKSNLDAIDAEAEDLVLEVIQSNFEEIVDKPEYRARVKSIAGRLASLEGYVVLQDIDLHPYSRLVKGIEQFLDGQTSAALQTLRHASQDSSNRQLQRLSLYWAAKMSNAVGNYDQARNFLDQAKDLVGEKDTLEAYEFARLHLQSEFFQQAEEAGDESPLQRLRRVKGTLVELAAVSKAIVSLSKHRDDQHAHHDVAGTRADIFSWVAYRPARLCEQLPADARSAAAAAPFEETEGGLAVLDNESLAEVFDLSDDALRAWALLQAKRIYPDMDTLHSSEGTDFSLIFGRAECDFALDDGHDVEEYRALEGRAIEDRVGAHREHRWAVELAQIALVGRARLLKHVEMSLAATESEVALAAERRAEPTASGEEANRLRESADHLRRDVEASYVRLQEALHGAPDHTVKIFSHLQRRNLSVVDFREEALRLKRQALGEADGVDERAD